MIFESYHFGQVVTKLDHNGVKKVDNNTLSQYFLPKPTAVDADDSVIDRMLKFEPKLNYKHALKADYLDAWDKKEELGDQIEAGEAELKAQMQLKR